ncbi:hypothetical protein EYF80_064813 [Liparis tanakae]|uniref:Uncharacterized protein n=1 Tax=Liparis tanakae TaxID=230148 RepID=A0A4Z2E913_9TELE|nr:hypothetical protein EYF80_064813 [Liparis tanakae]
MSFVNNVKPPGQQPARSGGGVAVLPADGEDELLSGPQIHNGDTGTVHLSPPATDEAHHKLGGGTVED